MSDLKRPIHVYASDEVQIPRGRPRVRGVNPWSHYEGSSDGKTRPRCRAPGCTNHLRKSQVVACSAACLRKLKIEAAILMEGCEHDEKVADAEALQRHDRGDEGPAHRSPAA